MLRDNLPTIGTIVTLLDNNRQPIGRGKVVGYQEQIDYGYWDLSVRVMSGKYTGQLFYCPPEYIKVKP
jgi:hypothetical protein